MDATKWRISKACHECRARKIRCNGQHPCERCRLRSLDCAYREKARNRQRKRPAPRASAPATPSTVDDTAPGAAPSGQAPEPGPAARGEGSIHNHSVAATHRASPSCLVQLYYGPSSNFSLLHSIYHQIEGTRPASPGREGVEEVGPGLDLFSHRRLYFGDLADTQRSFSRSEDQSGVFLDLKTATKFLERYLMTYWNGLPVLPKNEMRRKLEAVFSLTLFKFDSPDVIIIVLALALGAYMLGQGEIAEFLFQKAKHGASKLDEVVNIQVVQIYILMISTRVRNNPASD